MSDTRQKAADVVLEAVRDGRMAFYAEADKDGEFRIIFPIEDVAIYAELAYKVADRIAEHNVSPGPAIHLRD